MIYQNYPETFELTWAFPLPMTQSFTPKTLIETDEQVLQFTKYIRSQQDAIQEKNKKIANHH